MTLAKGMDDERFGQPGHLQTTFLPGKDISPPVGSAHQDLADPHNKKSCDVV
jgi:hypothetical protein